MRLVKTMESGNRDTEPLRLDAQEISCLSMGRKLLRLCLKQGYQAVLSSSVTAIPPSIFISPFAVTVTDRNVVLYGVSAPSGG
jgi:hypothetical protein